MALYKDTLEQLLNEYPSLFLDEEDVLEHLFFTCGNGMSWKRGELIDRDNISTGSQSSTAIARERKENLEWRISCAKRAAKLPEVIGNCWFLLEDGSVGKKLQRLTPYDAIFNIPANVKPDWKVAALKAIDMCHTKRWVLTPTDLEKLNKVKTRLLNMGTSLSP